MAASPAATGTGRAEAEAVVVSGHGFGHGIGLSQWGAEERAKGGWSYARILDFYYPGTTLGRAPATQVRVLLGEQPRVQLGSGAPFTIRDAAGAVVRLAAGRYSIDPAGRIGSQVVRLPAVARPGGAPLRLGGTGYEGTLRLEASGQRVRVVDTLELEDYLVGVVSSECPGYWHADALRAQAVASRSYALANLHPAADFDVYPDDRSQSYHGLQKHLPGAAAAVASTRGHVLRYRGAVVEALFSAANGGLTSVADDIWTSGSAPYFAARPDAFDAKSPNTNWGPFTISLAAVRKAFPELPASVTDGAAVRNAGRRVTALTFTGADGSAVTIGGYAFQQRLGLRSTFFQITPKP
jgi:stage II sporulation protein D